MSGLKSSIEEREAIDKTMVAFASACNDAILAMKEMTTMTITISGTYDPPPDTADVTMTMTWEAFERSALQVGSHLHYADGEKSVEFQVTEIIERSGIFFLLLMFRDTERRAPDDASLNRA